MGSTENLVFYFTEHGSEVNQLSENVYHKIRYDCETARIID